MTLIIKNNIFAGLQSFIFSQEWPILNTSSMNDYTQAEEFADTAPFVWFVNKHITIDEGFNFSWRPSHNHRNMVHSFPQCNNKKECKPIRWDVCKLVPTRVAPVDMIKQDVIAAFTKNIFQVFAYSTSSVNIDRKFAALRQIAPEARLVTKKNCNLHHAAALVAPRAMSSYVWLVDLDLQLPEKFAFDYEPAGGSMYTWSASAYGVTTETDAIRLIDRRALRTPLHELSKVPTGLQAGMLRVATDPMGTWIRYFVDSIRALAANRELPDATHAGNMTRFASRAITNASAFFDKFSDDPEYVFGVLTSPATIAEYYEYFKNETAQS